MNSKPRQSFFSAIGSGVVASAGFRSRSGAALVVVLGFIVILVALAVLFLLRTNTERSAAASFAAAVQTEQLADTAASFVQGQIRDATTRSGNVAWTSQPGMLRTFDTSGNPVRAYKLYSAASLVYQGDSGGFATELARDVPPPEWASKRALWTDLNAPVQVARSDGSTFSSYPILDAAAIGRIEGFSVADAPGASAAQPVPMPVRWLYVLRDGSLVAPEPMEGNRARIPGATRATGEGGGNPIVGRIAFWTDDETCKLNINTASEGTFWDIPRFYTRQEMEYGRFQPAQKEFQRYPGHPAMTSLAPVFFAVGNPPRAPNPLSENQRNAIFQIVPRIVGGGSDGGSKVAEQPLVPSTDRLYASVDELIFDPARQLQLDAVGIPPEQLRAARFFLTANSRAPETTLFNTPRVAMWPIDVVDDDEHRSAYDRLLARCATINQQPYYFTRSDPGSMTADFPGPPTGTPQTGLGRNRNLYHYLQTLTARPIPGFGGSFEGKYGADRDQILTMMFDYIRSTNTDDSTLQGITGDGSSRRYGLRYREGSRMTWPPYWPANPQRVSVDTNYAYGFNQVTPIRIESSPGAQTQGFGVFPQLTEAGFIFLCAADGDQGQPGGLYGSNVSTNKTLENLLGANERRIEVLFLVQTMLPKQTYPGVNSSLTLRVRGLETLEVTSGTTTRNLGFPADDAAWLRTHHILGPVHTNKRGGFQCARWAISMGSWLPARPPMPSDNAPALFTYMNSSHHNRNDVAEQAFYRYPFVSLPVTVTVDPSAQTMRFSGGTLTLDLYRGRQYLAGGSGTPVQTITLRFDPADIPIPSLVAEGTPGLPGTGDTPTAREHWWTFSADGCMPGHRGRLANMGWRTSAIGAGQLTRPGDVVRTVVQAGHSDSRLLARPVVGGEFFAPHPLYANPAEPLAHSFVTDQDPVGGASQGAGHYADIPVFGDTNTPSFARPKIPVGNSAARASGDWETGIGRDRDGPYINLPDSGTSIFLRSGGPPAVPYFAVNMQSQRINHGDWYSNEPLSNSQTRAYNMGPVFTLHSPNRQVPSAAMFGSLPSGVIAQAPFRTLLFRPQPGHFGAGTPPDHLWADLFWMPVVEPYAISEPFSTAGKTNMNYQILPFRYLTRRTALAGILRGEKVAAVGQNQSRFYKGDVFDTIANTNYRSGIDIAETLAQFDAKFAGNGVFVSASQICDLHLVPEGQSLQTFASGSFWDDHRLTGDNTRERPYANLLGRLTTKSNTFTVHFRVQPLKKVADADPEVWDEDVDRTVAEARGATVIERYINPNDAQIPDFATQETPSGQEPPDLGAFYKWRILSKRIFSP